MKAAGLSETETSRLHQYERYLVDSVECLRQLKSYRTPEALRTFARLFILVLPPLYAPAFASTSVHLGSLSFGIIFAVITTLGLAALFESIEILEDPFVGYVMLDGIDVEEELLVLHWQQLSNAREVNFPNANVSFPTQIQKALVSSLRDHRSEEDLDLDSFLDSTALSMLVPQTQV